MAKGFQFKPRSAGYREILNSSEMGADMLRRAEAGAAAARSTALVDSGEYQDGIVAELVTTDRKVGRVIATAPHSLVVESRTRNLGSAIDAAGGG